MAEPHEPAAPGTLPEPPPPPPPAALGEWESSEHPPAEIALPEPVFTPFSLTVGDGFKFGCGFTMAVVIALLIGMLVLSLVLLAASLAGVPLTFGR